MDGTGPHGLYERLRDFNQLAEAVPLGIFRMSADRRIRYANGRFTEMFGLVPGDVLPQILEKDDEDRVESELFAQLDRSGGLLGRAKNEGVEFSFTAPGTDKQIHVHLFASTNARGVPEALGYCEDISEQKSRRSELLAEARTDPLTGLANRKAMNEFFDFHPKRSIAVLLIDLDGFKQLNETFGHAAGDAVIRTFAQRLRDAVRPTDLVVRLGGDEFVIVAPGVNTYDNALVIADRIHPLFRLPIVFDTKTIELSATIGVALGKPGESAPELLKLADQALYEAKRSGRDRISVHRGDENAESLTPVVLRRELRRALEEEELHVELQPIVRLEGGIGSIDCEALLRWDHPKFGSISPSQIIPVAEQTGMIRPLGRFTAEAAARAAGALSALTTDTVHVGLNLSATQISDVKFLPSFVESLDRHGVTVEQLPIELTESHRVHEVDGAIEALDELVAMGAQIVIDDFGAGVSTYEYLLTLPVDVVKVDKVFTDHVTTDRGFEMLRSFAQACTNLGMPVVAEGIETAEQLEAVRAAGVGFGQGYLLSPPVAIEEFLDAVARSYDVILGRREAA